MIAFLSHTEIGDTDLNRKISLCLELLEVAGILEPGKSIFRGKLLVDLQEAYSAQIDRRLNDGEISKVVARVSSFCSEIIRFAFILNFISLLSLKQEKYREQLDLLSEAISIFEYDATMKTTLAKRLQELTTKIQQPTV